MEQDHSYRNVVKLEVDERALSPSRWRSVFIGTFLALPVLLLAVLLVAAAILYFQKDRKLQELEGLIEKIRTTLQFSNRSFSTGNKSDSFRLSDAYLLGNIHQTFTEMQAHLKDMRASQDAAEVRYQAKSWQDAEAACQSHGAHLTSVTSREEMGYVRSTCSWQLQLKPLSCPREIVTMRTMTLNKLMNLEFLSRETKGKQVWIGLTDQGEEGTWTWVDGTRHREDPSFWLPGQPDNWTGAPEHQENCVTLKTKWNDVSCMYSYRWICKRLF